MIISSQRLDSYQTGHANKVEYLHLFRLNEESFKLENDLYRLDSIKLPAYLKTKQLDYLHCDLNGGKEWYWKNDAINYEELLINFLKEENILFTKTNVDIRGRLKIFLISRNLKKTYKKN